MKPYIKILIILFTCYSTGGQAAVGIDRTRVIVNGNKNSEVISISNSNNHNPYLAQSWIENSNGEKIEGPLIATPPLQRLEAGEKSLVKISQTSLGEINLLPQDRESLFYFNVREIPPKSDKPNTLQIALQSKVKLFYRPIALVPEKNQLESPWQDKITLTVNDGMLTLNNPTGYFITIMDAQSTKDATTAPNFVPFMVAPKSSVDMKISFASLGKNPVLTYINDFGGHPKLTFNCSGMVCKVATNEIK